MDRLGRSILWIPTFVLLVAFAVPWFLWGTDTVVAGLPIWLWWHIGWLGLCSAIFYRFTVDSWDRLMGIDPDDGARVAIDGRETMPDRRNGGDR